MASLPYPLGHDCQVYLVDMAGRILKNNKNKKNIGCVKLEKSLDTPDIIFYN